MAKFTMRAAIGKNTITIDSDKMSDLFKFNSTYGKLPSKCDACGDEHIMLSHKAPKGNDYYMLECVKCGATTNFGILKSGGLFWKGEKMVVFKGNGKTQTETNAEKVFDGKGEVDFNPEDMDDSVPF